MIAKCCRDSNGVANEWQVQRAHGEVAFKVIVCYHLL